MGTTQDVLCIGRGTGVLRLEDPWTQALPVVSSGSWKGCGWVGASGGEDGRCLAGGSQSGGVQDQGALHDQSQPLHHQTHGRHDQVH